MKKIFFTVSLIFMSVATASASELYGKITYKGKPVENAEVTAKDKKTKTSAIGYYSLTLDPGGYILGIKLPDGSTREEKVDVFPQDTEKNLKLE